MYVGGGNFIQYKREHLTSHVEYLPLNNGYSTESMARLSTIFLYIESLKRLLIK